MSWLPEEQQNQRSLQHLRSRHKRAGYAGSLSTWIPDRILGEPVTTLAILSWYLADIAKLAIFVALLVEPVEVVLMSSFLLLLLFIVAALLGLLVPFRIFGSPFFMFFLIDLLCVFFDHGRTILASCANGHSPNICLA